MKYAPMLYHAKLKGQCQYMSSRPLPHFLLLLLCLRCATLHPPVLQVACVCAFSQTLRRYTSLNHLAQAARAVLQNSTQITQMLSDLNRVDFTNVQVWPVLFFLFLLA